MHTSPPPGLWDSFWAEHASSEQLFHRLLWRIRHVFSYAYAISLVRGSRSQSAGRILEVGSGSARTLHYLCMKLPQSQGFVLDLAPEALKIVRRISPGFLPTGGDALDLPFAAKAFQATFSIGLIEHFDRVLAARIVREMVRVTEPRGLVAVMVPWQSSFYNLVRLVFGRHWPFGHEQPFRRAELGRFMLSQGLTEVHVRVIYVSTLLAIGYRLDSMPELP